MAYRRRQGLSRSSTFKEEILRQPDQDDATTSSAALPPRASDPRLDSFRSSGAFHSSFKHRSKSSANFDNTSMKNTNERGEFWRILARKAKSILEDEVPQKSSKKPETISFSTSSQFTGIQVQHQYESYESLKKMDNPTLRMGLYRHRLMLSLNQIGDAVGNALEADKKTQDIIQETCIMRNRRRTFDDQEKNQGPRIQSAQPRRNQETQQKASRDMALATAAKVKQLARELKTTTAELEFAKERCSRLEEENKLLQEAQEKGDHPADDDDMIRVQLETLLAEKGHLAHENSVYARENRYLREIVGFHQMKMQDMVYFDEDIKETFQDPMEEPLLQPGLTSSPESTSDLTVGQPEPFNIII